jgi:hypothetical protein
LCVITYIVLSLSCASATMAGKDPPNENRTIKKITREESDRRYIPEKAIAFFKYTKNDIKYIHTILKTDTYYRHDEKGNFSVYHFDDAKHVDELMTKLDKNKISANIVIKRGTELIGNTYTENTSDGEEKEWKIVSKQERKTKNPENINDKETTNQKTPPKETPNKNAQNPNDENVVKIRNHTIKPGNPFALKAIFQKYNIITPTTNYHSHKINTTTLAFSDKKTAVQFIEKIPTTEFGPQASYELYKPARLEQSTRDQTQDWNAVIRGVDTEIDIADFERELLEHGVKFRKTNRITTANGDKTLMVRIFFEDEETTKLAIFNGITILGRRYRVEPPRNEARHIPCRKCAQYGHKTTECKNAAICHKCGGRPGTCTHPPTVNLLYCATCRGTDHYTGQVRCRLYPRSTPPPEQARQLPLTQQNTISPPRPSASNFPALSQSVWSKNPLTEQPTKDTNSKETTSTATTGIKQQDLEQKLDAAFAKLMEIITKKLEDYVDARITEATEKMIKFTTTMINSVQPTQTKTIGMAANNTAKKLWRKRVKMVPLKNSMEIMIGDLREVLREDFNQLMRNTLSPSTETTQATTT